AVLASASPAAAQTKDELNRARQEFQEGVALAAANNCAGAIAKFRSVARVKSTPQVLFNIAECEERMGRLAAALGDYRVAASAAADDAKAKDVYAKCGDRIAELEKRVPKLTVTRGKGADTATIELDGVELGAAQLGTEIPVDPGPHVVVGKVGEKEYSRDAVTLGEKESKTVVVTMKVANRPLAVDEAPAAEPKPDEGPPPEKPRSRVPGIVVASAGAVSTGIGFVFFAMSQGAKSDLDKLCGGTTSCPNTQEAKSKADSGRLDMGLAEALVGVGVVALVTGVVLAVTAGPKKAAAAPAALAAPSKRLSFVGVAPGASVGGASLIGRF
ncbi:MAG TPA: hypothetical protein VHB21_20325, partial [Minicystis sp.]|nr:hypothetical protein [Minicystis sp.]